MANNMLVNLSLSHLRRAVALKEQIVALESQLCEVIGVPSPLAFIQERIGGKTTRTRSPAARAKMAAAQRARWARVKGKSAGATGAPAVAAKTGRRKMSPKVRARLSVLARARWARVRASGKKTLAG
jgi:hypothetical protein